MREKIKAKVFQKDICVLATAAKDRPHCSLMAYAVDEQSCVIYMATSNDTRKFRNISENPYVSLMIDSRETRPRTEAWAITVYGHCEPVHDVVEEKNARKMLRRKHSHLGRILDMPGCRILAIRIESILFLDGLTESYFFELDQESRQTILPVFP